MAQSNGTTLAAARETGAVGAYFKVHIDDVDGSYDLGTFISCEGLGLDVQIQDHTEGGNNAFVWKLPTRITYSNVTLKRPLGPDSTKLAKWFSSLAGGVTRTTGHIVALTPHGEELVEWTLTGVIPVRWQGPAFSAESPALATETLEIAHHGFTVR
ncbi:MAG TPA: phage tail protein [Actinomycetota bacterium]|nr:phage tail protein [Actinomycetota bacterium]